MTTFSERHGIGRFMSPRVRDFTVGRGVHAQRHVRRPGRLALRKEGTRGRGHRP